MKTLGKIKLNQFSKDELDQRTMNVLKGGVAPGGEAVASCSCSIWSAMQREIRDGLGKAGGQVAEK